MKIGDVVYSVKVRPYEKAIIIKSDVEIKWRENKNGQKKKETKTTYIAQYPDMTCITFYGFNINKTIFKHIEPDGQLSLSDIF